LTDRPDVAVLHLEFHRRVLLLGLQHRLHVLVLQHIAEVVLSFESYAPIDSAESVVLGLNKVHRPVGLEVTESMRGCELV